MKKLLFVLVFILPLYSCGGEDTYYGDPTMFQCVDKVGIFEYCHCENNSYYCKANYYFTCNHNADYVNEFQDVTSGNYWYTEYIWTCVDTHSLYTAEFWQGWFGQNYGISSPPFYHNSLYSEDYRCMDLMIKVHNASGRITAELQESFDCVTY